jgi:hypothetical protein
MALYAADSSELNSRGQAFLQWFHDLWDRWHGVFDWAGGFQGFAAVVVGIALIILILYGVSNILRGGWIAVKGIGELLYDALSWLIIDLPEIWKKKQRKLAQAWKRREATRNRMLDTPVGYTIPTPRKRVTARARTTPPTPRPATAPAPAKTYAYSPPPQSTTPPPADPLRLSQLTQKFGPPRPGRHATPASPGSTDETVIIKLHKPADIVVNEDTEVRKSGQAPSAARDKQFWQLADACVALFREHATFSNIQHNAMEPPVGVVAVNHQGVARGTYPFSSIVANLPGWTTALPGSPARMEAYVTHTSWEVVASCVVFEGNKAKLVSWRMSSAAQGVSNVSLSPQGQEYGVTVEEAYRLLARFLKDLAHPRF